ncbi:MAG: hypothetical protein LUH10_17220 [Tannerellaceae bacterium]|nr:hypothetical protein [Tannerellaceae bacterium]
MKAKIFRKNNGKLVIVTTIAWYIYMGIRDVGYETYFSINNIVAFVMLIMLYKLDKKQWNKIFHYFYKIYAFVCMMGIIITVLKLLGINLFFGDIYPSMDGSIYHHYIYSFMVCLCDEGRDYMRFCSIYNEPGVVGTVSALLLVADEYDLRRKDNIIIFLGGILSFSTAFFMLTMLYLIMRFFIDKFSLKKVAIVLIILLLVIAMDLLLYERSEIYTVYVHDKIMNLIFYGKSNRATEALNNAFENYIHDGTQILMGMGGGAWTEGGSLSIKKHIYEYGVIGTILFFLMLWAIYISNNNGRKASLYFYLLYLISLYQRPYIFNAFALLILYGGLIHIKNKKMKLNFREAIKHGQA